MKYRTRTYYTDGQKALIWERWKEGWMHHQIAQLFNRAHTSEQGILSRTGDFRPPVRSRCSAALMLAERESISSAVVNCESIHSIASLLGRAPSTISREIKRKSHETPYRSLFIQARGAFKKELLQHLRLTRGMRRSRHHTQKTNTHGQIIGAVSICERLSSGEDCGVSCHWEREMVFGRHNRQIATLVERQTRYVMLVKVGGKDTEKVVYALIKNAHKIPQELFKSLTWDRRTESRA